MTDFSTRLRLIYVPFLWINVLFIIIYSFLHWLFVIALELPLNDELVHYWLIVILAWIPVLIWLRPRIRLLILKDKKGNLPFLYQFIAVFAIAIPAIIAQDYLVTATGKLTVLNDISTLNKQSPTKYFELKKHGIDKVHIAMYKRAEVTGKYSENYNMYIDFACPILADTLKPDSGIRVNESSGIKRLVVIDGIVADPGVTFFKVKPSDIISTTTLKNAEAMAIYGSRAKDGAIIIVTKHRTRPDPEYLTKNIPKAWLGVEFSRNISNHRSDERKEEEWKDFDSVTYAEFRASNLDDFIYLDRIGATNRHKAYTKEIDRLLNDETLKPLIFEAVTTPFEARNGEKLPWLFKSFAIGAAVWFLMILFPKLNEAEIEKLAGSTLSSRWKAFSDSFFQLKVGPSRLITVALIGLNLLVFVTMVFAGLGVISFDSRDLLHWGADNGPLVAKGQWWRLLTSTFLHGGLMHVANNMVGLFFVGIILEPLIGRLRYVSAYFICGILASLTSIWWHPDIVGIGASGAIFGLFGVLTALLTTKKVDLKSRKPLLIFCAIFVGFNLILGLTGSVDNAAHVGGLLSGLAVGYFFYFFTGIPDPVIPQKRQKKAKLTADSIRPPGAEQHQGDF